VLRVEVPAGEHRVALRPDDRFGSFGSGEEAKVTVADGRNTYVLANFADGRLIGKIVSSGN
jgi:hypothetical protein